MVSSLLFQVQESPLKKLTLASPTHVGPMPAPASQAPGVSAPVTQSLREMHTQAADQNVPTMMTAHLTKPVSETSVLIPAQEFAASMPNVGFPTTIRSALVFKITQEIHSHAAIHVSALVGLSMTIFFSAIKMYTNVSLFQIFQFSTNFKFLRECLSEQILFQKNFLSTKKPKCDRNS